MIKKILTLFTLCAAIGTAAAQSQNKEVEIKNVKIEKIGGNLDIRFQATVPAKSVKKNYKLTVVPILYNGSKQQQLQSIVVDSRRVRIVEERNGIAPLRNAVYAEQGKTVDYAVVLPYEQWMNGASLRANKTLAGCCTEQFQQPELVASNMVLVKPLVPHVEEVYVPTAVDKSKMIVPQIRQVERRWEFSKSDMIVDYGVSKVNIDPSLLNNRETLTELLDVIRKLYTGKDASIKKIEITGYSSPEGTSAMNSRLAMERAVSLKEYLQRDVAGLPNSLFKLENGGENWNGLRKAVADSYMPERSSVLNIIDNVPAEINYRTNTSRKKALMDFNGGRTWNYMLKNLFAQLRNACYIVIDYDKLVDAAAEEINRAIILIHNKEYDKALPLLLAVQDDARAWNPIGVCYMMTERFTEAREYLSKAATDGNAQAKENLKEIADR